MDTKVFKRSEILSNLTSKGFVITDNMLSCICEMVQNAGGAIIDDPVNYTIENKLPFDTIEKAVICNFPVYFNPASEMSFVPSVYFDGKTITDNSRNTNTLINSLTSSTLPIYWEEYDNLIGIGMVSDIDISLFGGRRRLSIIGKVKLNNNSTVQRFIADKRLEPFSNMFGIEPSLMTVLMVDESPTALTIHGIIIKAKTIHDYFLPDHNAKDKKPIINYDVGLFIKNPFGVEWDKVENLIEEAFLLNRDKYTECKNIDISIRKNSTYGDAIPTVGGYLCLLDFLGQVKPKFTIKTKYIFVSME